MPTNVLIVSDSGRVRVLLADWLRADGCAVTLAESWDEALEVVRRVAIDAAIIETRRADARARRLRDSMLQQRPGCRVVLVTGYGEVRSSTELLRFGREHFLLSGDQLPALLRNDNGGPPVASPTDGGERETAALVQVIDVLVGLLELRHKHFGGSSHQTMRLARAVAEELGLDESTRRELILATLLRDIGKVGIDDELLDQDAELNEDQRSQMRQHVDGSVRLLEHIDFPWKVLLTIRHHHERYDGTGYPDGLKGREIPIGARIVAAVDAYVAMVSRRSHRTALTREEAMLEIERGAGAQFDPEVAELLLKVVAGHRSRGAALQTPLVLLCEPDAEFRRLLKMKLVNENYEVKAVRSIRSARRRIRSTSPDLVVAAPGRDIEKLFDLLREVREDATLRRLPFLVLAETDDRIVKVRALREGADDFVAKAADLEEIVARIESIIARETSRRDDSVPTRRSGISGQIESLPLPDIVQTLVIGMKTACVSLATEDARGDIWFQQGKIVHAETAGTAGEPALFEMLRWREGEFVIRHGIQSPGASIDGDPMYLMLEGLRLLDEGESRQGQATAS